MMNILATCMFLIVFLVASCYVLDKVSDWVSKKNDEE